MIKISTDRAISVLKYHLLLILAQSQGKVRIEYSRIRVDEQEGQFALRHCRSGQHAQRAQTRQHFCLKYQQALGDEHSIGLLPLHDRVQGSLHRVFCRYQGQQHLQNGPYFPQPPKNFPLRVLSRILQPHIIKNHINHGASFGSVRGCQIAEQPSEQNENGTGLCFV